MCFLFVLADALYDGRLYRCDVRFSGEQPLADTDVGVSDEGGRRGESDEDSAGWEEREASRTHSVKFTDDVEENKEVGSSASSESGRGQCDCGRGHWEQCRCLCCCSYGRRVWAWLGACFGTVGGGRLRKAESFYMMYSELEGKDAL